jgi:bifunctional DNA-binding transcriptional regulator/antitoxin component of YhaV-PrlF toxin-antitoxin module
MSILQLHYDGWVTLPAVLRQKLDLSTGDRLEAEVSGETLVLRRATRVGASEPTATEPVPVPEPQPVEATAEATAPAATPEPVVKRGPGRPRKMPVAALPPTLKTCGRRKTALPHTAQPA